VERRTKTRSVTSRFAKVLVFGWVWAVATGFAAADDTRQLTLPEARAAAAQALRTGNPETTLLLTQGLIQANPRDGVAYYLRANAYAQIGQPSNARKAVARAYRLGVNSTQKFEAAQLAARLAVQEEKPGLAQLWLRRTAIHSPTEAADKGIARDYTILRRINPWSFRLSGSIEPSDNVNNGAESPANLINGEPAFGLPFSGSALALSGVVGTLDLRVAYRLRASKTSETSLSTRLYLQRVNLSDSARAAAPAASDSDFAFNYAEVSVSHGFRAGPKDKGGTARLGLDIGVAEYGGSKIYDFARLSGSRKWHLSSKTALEISGNVEYRDAPLRTLDATVYSLQATWQQAVGKGNRLDLTLGLRDSQATSVNGTSTSTSLRAVYRLGRKIGPARVQAGFGVAATDYPAYNLFLPVAGGRQDEAWDANIDFVFEDVDYAGFAPRLSIRTSQTESNISRFSTEQLTVTLGIASKF
jgi:hypothetical protein